MKKKKREDLSSANIRLAGSINFKNLPENVVKTDQYGFLLDNKEEKQYNENEKKNF